MSTQRIFDDIMNQFNSDEEDENEEQESSKHSGELKIHKKSSSLSESANNLIKDKLLNTNREVMKKVKKKRKRDEFGYFVNDDDSNDNDEENEEKSDSKENKDDDDNNNSNEKKEENEEEEEDENENDDKNINEKNNENDNNEGGFQEIDSEQDDKNKNDNNNNNIKEIKKNEEEKKEQNIKEKKEEQNINDEDEEKINEENDIIDELYYRSKAENLEQSEGELFRMGSFRPNPIPGSPKFSKKVSKSEEPIIKRNDKNINNNNLTNFTETIKTKIEGDKNNIQNKDAYNDKKNIPIFTHDNNIVSLGKIPSLKTSTYNSQLLNKKNNLIENKAIEQKQSKSSEDEEKAEEDFLKREELKRQKNKENSEKNKKKEETDIKNENENNINNKKEEEEGKENVTEDEDEDTKNKKNNLIKNYNNKMNNGSIQVETKEDSKENNNEINSSINSENNLKKNDNNDMEEIQIKEMSIKLAGQFQKAGNSPNNSVKHSHQNSGSKSKNNIKRNLGVNRDIYSKKTAPDRNNNKKVNNKIVLSKKGTYESPSDKSFGKKNINYSTDQNKIPSSKNNVSSFNYDLNSNFSKKINTRKKQELQSIKKNLCNQNNDIKNNSYEKSNKNSEEKYSFKPQINENSRKMYERKISNINNNKPELQKQTTPLGLLLLYEDANMKQKKKNREYIKQNNDIIYNANKKKMNDNSYNMVNNRLNKKIDNAINKFQKNYKLNIVNMTQVLYELNIINELIKPKDIIKDINVNNELDLGELQAMAESVKDKDMKKSEEVELIEQLWYLLNPKLDESFNCEILSIFLKLFFCANYTQKELEVCITSLLENYKINNAEKKEEEEEEKEKYKSPLRDIIYDKNQIWPLTKFIKVFLNLKRNMKAYRENDYTKGDVYNNIIKEKDKELTFEPDFEKTNKYFYKYSKFQYNKDNSIIDIINKYSNKNPKQKHDFNKVYERFKADKELHEKTLQRIREIQEEKELKMCTNIPKINKYNPQFKSPSKNQEKQPRYKLLYNLRKKYDKNEKENRIDKDDIIDENCTFQPKTTDREVMNKTFSNLKKKKKPKGFNDYVNRNRSLLKSKEHEKKLEEDKKYGRGYDKIHKMKIKPLNMTFLNKSDSKPKKNKQYINNTETNSKKRYHLENEKVENVIDSVYITMDIRVSNGLIKPLKIYNKNDKGTIEDVTDFCKKYKINEETQKDLIKKALKFKFNFFGKNKKNNKNEIILKENLDNIPNAFGNDGNILSIVYK